MDWAQRRRIAVIAVLATIVIVLVSGIAFAVFYQVPTCSDHVQNQGETGVDCGGPCSTVCSAAAVPPQVEFARALYPQPGRIDGIAYVENPNSGAEASNVHGTFELYGADGALLAKQEARFDLPPSSAVPVFLPGLSFADATDAHAFFTIATSSVLWRRVAQAPARPEVTNVSVPRQGSAPRITALLANPTAEPVYNLPVIVTVFDAQGNAIAASRTVVQELPPQGTAPVIFTWNAPFPGTPADAQIVPLIAATP